MSNFLRCALLRGLVCLSLSHSRESVRFVRDTHITHLPLASRPFLRLTRFQSTPKEYKTRAYIISRAPRIEERARSCCCNSPRSGGAVRTVDTHSSLYIIIVLPRYSYSICRLIHTHIHKQRKKERMLNYFGQTIISNRRSSLLARTTWYLVEPLLTVKD